MTIDEAIEILESPRYGTVWPTPPKESEAVQLGIEALTYIRLNRYADYPHHFPPLHGETNE